MAFYYVATYSILAVNKPRFLRLQAPAPSGPKVRLRCLNFALRIVTVVRGELHVRQLEWHAALLVAWRLHTQQTTYFTAGARLIVTSQNVFDLVLCSRCFAEHSHTLHTGRCRLCFYACTTSSMVPTHRHPPPPQLAWA